LRRLLNLNSRNHNPRRRRRRFYLAVLIERPTFAPRYDISHRRIRASHVNTSADFSARRCAGQGAAET
jgi:hypothetical protein